MIVSGEVFVHISGDVSGEVVFATIAHFYCCEISSEVSGEVSGEISFFIFYFLDEPFFASWSKSGVIICYR